MIVGVDPHKALFQCLAAQDEIVLDASTAATVRVCELPRSGRRHNDVTDAATTRGHGDTQGSRWAERGPRHSRRGGRLHMGHASKLVDLSTFETESLPLRNAAAISNPYSNAAPSVPFEYLLAPCRQLIHQAASCVAKAPPFRKSPTLSIPRPGSSSAGSVPPRRARTPTETTCGASVLKRPACLTRGPPSPPAANPQGVAGHLR